MDQPYNADSLVRHSAHFSFSILGLSIAVPYIISTVIIASKGHLPSSEHGGVDTSLKSTGLSARYNGPDDSEMNERQKKIRDKVLSSRKGTGLSGPFGPWLAVPEIADPSQELGRAVRYGTSLSHRESELVILLTGAKMKSHTEFDIHIGEALKAGLDMEIIKAIPRDDNFSMTSVEEQLVPLLANDREAAIARFTAELLDTYTVSDETYDKSKESLGGKDTVLVELVSIAGYYTYVSYTLNCFRIPSKPPETP